MTIESTTSIPTPIEESNRATAILKAVAMRQELESRVDELRSRHSTWRSRSDSRRFTLGRALLFAFGVGKIVAATMFVVWIVNSGEPETWKIALAVVTGVLGYTQTLLLMVQTPAERNELRILEALLDTHWRTPGEPEGE